MASTLVASCMLSWTAYPRDSRPIYQCDSFKAFPQLVPIPEFKNAWQLVESCNAFMPERVSVALMIFQNAWIKQFGKNTRITKNLHGILIHWSHDKQYGTGYSINGDRLNSAVVSGKTLTAGYVWVKIENHETRICETSLVHELVHASLWAVKGSDGDPDHLGLKFSGWTPDHSALIQNVNQALCRLGI